MLPTNPLGSVAMPAQHNWQPSPTDHATALHNQNNHQKNHRLRLSSDHAGCFTLPAPAREVSLYLEAHHEWFERCAYPMATHRLGPNSYRLCPGRFQCLNFSVEPAIDMQLTPLADGSYQVRNIPIEPPIEVSMYEIDFCLSLWLSEMHQAPSVTDVVTTINWEITVAIGAELPGIVRKMPTAVVRHAGGQLLKRVINQVVQQLTARIKTDFTDKHRSSSTV